MRAGSDTAVENWDSADGREHGNPLVPALLTARTASTHQAMADRPDAKGLEDFRALVAGHRGAIYRVAYRLTGNEDDAEDLVQESLIEAFQAFDRFHIGTHFDRWVYRIMTRTYIDKYRRRKHLDAASLNGAIQEENLAEPADAGLDPQDALDRKTWSEPIQSAMDRLSPEFRTVVVLCDVEELSYEEASKILGCPVGTVRSRLHRARDQLRAWLRPLLGDDER